MAGEVPWRLTLRVIALSRRWGGAESLCGVSSVPVSIA